MTMSMVNWSNGTTICSDDLRSGVSSFSHWIKRRRKELDLTQDELGDLVGCSISSIRKIESARLRPSKEIAQRLIECLAIPAADRPRFLRMARWGLSEPAGQTLELSVAGAATCLSCASHAASPAPAQPPAGPLHNLPRFSTSFVGREAQIAALLSLLEQNSLVTLLGPAGVGKTRLALQVAERQLGRFRDGICFVQLAGLSGPEQLAWAIAQALPAAAPGDCSPDALLARLNDRQMLLVLDTFEHIWGAGPWLASLWRAAPGLRFLVTSREVLHIYGEQLFPLAPLSPPSAHEHAPERLLACESVRLLVNHLRCYHPGFQPSSAEAPYLGEICRRLEGLPLAIELAAAQTRRYPLEELPALLAEPLALLSSPSRTVPERQKSMRAAIAWSYELLGQQERALFLRLGAMAGPISMEMLEQACDPALRGCAADLAQQLVDKSLLQSHISDRKLRFHMLHVVRAFAREQRRDSPGQLCLHVGQLATAYWTSGSTQYYRLDPLPLDDLSRDALRALLFQLDPAGPDEDGWFRARLPDGGLLDICFRGLNDLELDGGTLVVRQLSLDVADLIYKVLSAGKLLLLPMALAPPQSAEQAPQVPWPRLRILETAAELHALLSRGAHGWWLEQVGPGSRPEASSP